MSKNKSTSINKKLIALITVASSIVLVAMRSLNLRFFIDSETGFVSGGNALYVCFWVIFGLSILSVLVLSNISNQCNNLTVSNGKSKMWICNFVLAAFFCLDIVSTLNTQNQYVDTTMTQSAQNVVVYCGYLKIFFAILSAIYFFVFAIDNLRGTNGANRLKVLALAPSVWAVLRLVPLFTTQIAFIRVSELLLKIASHVALALFFYGFAQQVSDVYSKNNEWKFFAYASSASICLFSSVIPKLLFLFIQSGTYNNNSYPLDSIDVVLAFYMIFLLFSGNYKIAEKSDNKEAENENSSENQQ